MKYRLDDICEFINGGTWSDKEYTDDGIPVLKVSNIKRNGFAIEELNYIPYELLNKYRKHLLRVGDVVIATVGSHPNLVESAAGRSCVITQQVKDFLLNQNAVCIRSKNKDVLLQSYLGSLCKTRDFQHFIQMRGKGAANQMRIAISAIKDYECDIPDLLTQKKIGESLSAYDELVENNQKQIKLLEEAAQRLYKEWFFDLRFPGYETTPIVNGIPEGWYKDSIGNLISKIERTKQIKTSDYCKYGAIPIIDQSTEFIAGYTDDKESLNDIETPVIVFGDHTRILKYIQFPFAKGADGTQLLVSNNSRMPQSLFYCSLCSVDLSNYHYARHFKYLKAESIIIPSQRIADKFDNIVSPIFAQIQILRDKSNNAKQARDRLLPKLMSGEIEV